MGSGRHSAYLERLFVRIRYLSLFALTQSVGFFLRSAHPDNTHKHTGVLPKFSLRYRIFNGQCEGEGGGWFVCSLQGVFLFFISFGKYPSQTGLLFLLSVWLIAFSAFLGCVLRSIFVASFIPRFFSTVGSDSFRSVCSVCGFYA